VALIGHLRVANECRVALATLTAASSGPIPKAPGSAGGYLLMGKTCLQRAPTLTADARHVLGLDHLADQQTSNWIQLVLATPVVLWAGWPFFVRGWKSLVTRSLNMLPWASAWPGSTARSRPSYLKSFRRHFASRAARWRCISRPRPRSRSWYC
jgi:hypothetical protein